MLATLRSCIKFELTWKTAVQAVFFVGLAVAITIYILSIDEQIGTYAERGYWGVFVVSVLGNATIILPTPSFAIVFAGGAVLNPWIVGLAAGVGASLGEFTSYFAGIGGRATLMDDECAEKIRPFVERWGVGLIFVLSVIPNPLIDVAGMIAGMIKMPWWRFLMGAMPGKCLRFITLSVVGGWLLG